MSNLVTCVAVIALSLGALGLPLVDAYPESVVVLPRVLGLLPSPQTGQFELRPIDVVAPFAREGNHVLTPSLDGFRGEAEDAEDLAPSPASSIPFHMIPTSISIQCLIAPPLGVLEVTDSYDTGPLAIGSIESITVVEPNGTLGMIRILRDAAGHHILVVDGPELGTELDFLVSEGLLTPPEEGTTIHGVQLDNCVRI